MIRYFHKSLHSSKTKEYSTYQSGCWLYVEKPTEAELDYLVKQFNLERGHLEDALDENEMPRLEREGNYSYIFVRFAYKSKRAETDTAPFLFIFSDEVLITVSLIDLPSLDKFISGKVDYATTQRARLVLLILQQMSEHYDTLISVTSKQIKTIRNRLRGHDIGNRDFVAFVTIQDELNEFLASLQPTNLTLRRLLQGGYVPLFEEDQDIVEDLLLNNEQAIESCNTNIKSIENIREAYTAISNNNLNRTMKILTIATVVITIPLSITAIYSMNVPLPGQHDPNAFWVIVGVCLAVVVLVFVLGRRRRIF